MTTSRDPEFASFVRRRLRLNQRIDAGRNNIDAWIVEHEEAPGSMTELARLEALLKDRRDALAELVALDDEFMDHLIDLRSRGIAE